jgi:hypothetical protein
MILRQVAGRAGAGSEAPVIHAALALGIRHGIDWDHIAAITDITSTTSGIEEEEASWLIAEPGLMLTDEGHHSVHGPHDGHSHEDGPATEQTPHSHGSHEKPEDGPVGTATAPPPRATRPAQQRELFWKPVRDRARQRCRAVRMAAIPARVLAVMDRPCHGRVVGVTLILLSVSLLLAVPLLSGRRRVSPAKPLDAGVRRRLERVALARSNRAP